MSTQFFLDETDIEALTKLMLRSQQLRTREALCIRIGIDPRRLGFIKDSSDYDFVIELINYLNEISNKEALCKLCCKELLPIFSQSEKSATILSEIAAKLNCDQRLSQKFTNNQQPTVLSSSPAPSVSVNPFIQLAKNKFVRYIVIFLIGLVGLVLGVNIWLVSVNTINFQEPKMSPLEYNIDRPGEDYFIVPIEILLANPRKCADACAKQSKCQAWTYIKPGIRDNDPHCFLKKSVPDTVHNSCCVSGFKQ